MNSAKEAHARDNDATRSALPRRTRKTPTQDGMQIVHIQLPVELVKQIDHLAIDADVDRPTMTAALIRVGLTHELEAGTV
jgi:hypothetical protein